MCPASFQEGIEVQIKYLYFRLTLPIASAALLLTAGIALPMTRQMMLSVALLSLCASGLHWRSQPRHEARVALGYGCALVLLGFFWVVFGIFVPIRGDELQLMAICLFIPLTINSWGFVFFDYPRQRIVLSWLLSIAAFLILEQGIAHTRTPNPAPFFLLFANLVVIQRTSLILKFNGRFIKNRRELYTDTLTGLLNRRAFDEVESERSPMAYLIVLDIDHFKRINDTYGHPAGDRVLRAVGDVLLDKLNGRGQAYRWGGEEFVLLVPVTEISDIREWLDGVRAEIASRSFIDEQHVTVSAGVSLNRVGLSSQAAFAQADASLLEAKRAGRDQIRWHPAADFRVH